jgi:hypothetical protein
MKGRIIVQSCNAPAQPGIIKGNSVVCAGSSGGYSIAAVPGATSYSWTLPAGWIGSSTSDSISTISSGTAGDIMVIANNACGSSVASTLNITVNSVNTAVSVSGATLTAFTSGAVYQWIHCNNQNLPLSGEISQVSVATSSGSYAAIIAKNGCSDTSVCQSVLFTTDGVRMNDEHPAILLYPNPTNGRFRVDIDPSLIEERYDLKIYNSNGIEVYRVSIYQPELTTEVDLFALPDGLYFMKGYSGGKTFLEKIVKLE